MDLTKTFAVLLLTLFSNSAYAQIFTRVTTGAIVNDSGSSFGHSWCDFNNDGWEDIFINNLENNQPNFFYKNNGDGTFTKMSNIEIAIGNASTSSTWGDFNNDGNQDVFVANGGTVGAKKNYLFVNNGDETFTQTLTGTVVNQTNAFTVCSWLDVDNDSDLDLFVARSGGANQIFKNDGAGNLTSQNLNDSGNSWGISWSDYDNDGDLDGFGTNWGAPNYFYKNDGSNLSRIAFPPLTNGNSNSLSPSWGDYNNDGWQDLFVGNSADSDRLFKNNGDGTFDEILNSPITIGIINSEGSSWSDWDNDGDLDLIVSSGGNQSPGEVRLYENNGAGEFTEIEDGELTTLVGRYEGLTTVDYDKDGDLDIFISNYFNNDNLLYNNNGNDNHWINISLAGNVSNIDGIGAKIYVQAVIEGETVWQLREIVTHSGHVTQGSLKAHFGLGNATMIDSIKVVWPTQSEQILTNITPDQYLIIEEENPSQTNEVLKIKKAINFQVYPNPMEEEARISFKLNKPDFVKLEVLDLNGKLLTSLFSGKVNTGFQHFIWNGTKNGMDLPKGYYLVSMTLGDVNFSEKLLVVR